MPRDRRAAAHAGALSGAPALASARARIVELFAVDLRSLALLRIGLAALLLVDLALRVGDLDAFHTDAGVLPLEAWRQMPAPNWSLHALSGSRAWVGGLFVAQAGFAIALGFGFHTRIATFGSWLLLVSLHHRNPLVLIGSDAVLRLLLFWSLFLPLGARAAWDARRAKAPRMDRFLGVASAALLLQIAVIYPIAAAFKRREPVWQELRFLEEAMRVEGATTFLGRQLLELPDSVLAALTWLSLQFETWAVLLAFSPWATGPLRTLAVALFLGFHLLGLGATFSLGLFPLVMAVAWLAFLPPWFYERIGAWRPARPIAIRRAGLVPDFLAGCVAIGIALHLADTLHGRREPDSRAAIVPALVWRLGLEQYWSLWSEPPTNRYYVFPARLRDGRVVDLHRDGAPLDWDSPRPQSASNRWWKYQFVLSAPAAVLHAPLYARTLARQWSESHPPEEAVESVELWMVEDVPGLAGERARRRVRLWPRETPVSSPRSPAAARSPSTRTWP